ncbi:MAG TPA: carboxypeptidase-like regulatory domain-containing protein [Azonexus sp.]|nr:carboxypeptidase-like regulatory domain-containing protein [Azonexus sp.]
MRNILSIIALSLISSFCSVSAVEKSDQGLTYLSGGIGDEERDEILGREKDFNLKLVFAEKNGSYMADVNVVVLNAKGQIVLEASSTGPFFLTTLPTGNYRVKVTANGKTQQASLAITPKKRLARTFLW